MGPEAAAPGAAVAGESENFRQYETDLEFENANISTLLVDQTDSAAAERGTQVSPSVGSTDDPSSRRPEDSTSLNLFEPTHCNWPAVGGQGMQDSNFNVNEVQDHEQDYGSGEDHKPSSDADMLAAEQHMVSSDDMCEPAMVDTLLATTTECERTRSPSDATEAKAEAAACTGPEADASAQDGETHLEEEHGMISIDEYAAPYLEDEEGDAGDAFHTDHPDGSSYHFSDEPSASLQHMGDSPASTLEPPPDFWHPVEEDPVGGSVHAHADDLEQVCVQEEDYTPVLDANPPASGTSSDGSADPARGESDAQVTDTEAPEDLEQLRQRTSMGHDFADIPPTRSIAMAMEDQLPSRESPPEADEKPSILASDANAASEQDTPAVSRQLPPYYSYTRLSEEDEAHAVAIAAGVVPAETPQAEGRGGASDTGAADQQAAGESPTGTGPSSDGEDKPVSPPTPGSISLEAAEAVRSLRPPHQKLVQRLVAQGWAVDVPPSAPGRPDSLSHRDLRFTPPPGHHLGPGPIQSFKDMHSAVICSHHRPQGRSAASPPGPAPDSSNPALHKSRQPKGYVYTPLDPSSDLDMANSLVPEPSAGVLPMAEVLGACGGSPAGSPGEAGFVIVSRWGRVVHKKGCVCKPCQAKRRSGVDVAPLDEPLGDRAEDAMWRRGVAAAGLHVTIPSGSGSEGKRDRGELLTTGSSKGTPSSAKGSKGGRPAKRHRWESTGPAPGSLGTSNTPRTRPQRVAAVAATAATAAMARFENNPYSSPPSTPPHAAGRAAPSPFQQLKPEDPNAPVPHPKPRGRPRLHPLPAAVEVGPPPPPPGTGKGPGRPSKAAAEGGKDADSKEGLPESEGKQQITLRQLLRCGTFAGRSVEYRSRTGEILLTGLLTAEGLIKCDHCGGSEVTCSEFEDHAGSKERRPGESIFLSNGTSLKDFCTAINEGGPNAAAGGRGRGLVAGGKQPRGMPAASLAAAAAAATAKGAGAAADGRKERDSNKHKRLFQNSKVLPQGSLLSYKTAQDEVLLTGTVSGNGILCSCCNQTVSCSQFEVHAGRGTRRAPYDSIFTEDGINLRKLASELPDEEDDPVGPPPALAAAREPERAGGDAGELDLPDLVARCRRLLADLDSIAGGCVLCRCSDFLKDGFGPRTIIICDQCEREFHVGCLHKHKSMRLTKVPEGDWFCSGECSSINRKLQEALAAGPMEVHGADGSDFPEHQWQLQHGRSSHTPARAIQTAMSILQESFEPICDLATGVDLVPMMVHSQHHKDHDFQGMFTVVLKHRGKPVTAATLRVFGRQIAEMPLVATRECARRQGHCRALMAAVETFLADLQVQDLCLPAAAASEATWIHGFHFSPMEEELLRVARAELRLLCFPEARMLVKPVLQTRPQPLPSIPAPTPKAARTGCRSAGGWAALDSKERRPALDSKERRGEEAGCSQGKAEAAADDSDVDFMYSGTMVRKVRTQGGRRAGGGLANGLVASRYPRVPASAIVDPTDSMGGEEQETGLAACSNGDARGAAVPMEVDERAAAPGTDTRIESCRPSTPLEDLHASLDVDELPQPAVGEAPDVNMPPDWGEEADAEAAAMVDTGPGDDGYMNTEEGWGEEYMNAEAHVDGGDMIMEENIVPSREGEEVEEQQRDGEPDVCNGPRSDSVMEKLKTGELKLKLTMVGGKCHSLKAQPVDEMPEQIDQQ